MAHVHRGIWILAASLLLTACANRHGLSWLEWTSVPACHTAIEERALSEFGEQAEVEFQGVADQERLENGRVHVKGARTVARKGEKIKLSYECPDEPPSVGSGVGDVFVAAD